MTDAELERWLSRIEAEVLRCVSGLKYPDLDEPFYAFAFWGFYCDQTVIHPPCFAINTPSGIRLDGNWSSKWCPPEWKHDVVSEFNDSLMPLYLEFSDALSGASGEFWDRAYNKHYDLYCAICREVSCRADEYLPNLKRTGDFLVVVVEDQHGGDSFKALLRGSVSPKHLVNHPDLKKLTE